MSVKRLTEKHPLMGKLEALFNLMAAEGIRIHTQADMVFVNYKGLDYRILDADSSYHDTYPGPCLPPEFEFKVCRDGD